MVPDSRRRRYEGAATTAHAKSPELRQNGFAVTSPSHMRLASLCSNVLAILLAVFIIALTRGKGEEDARALTFTTLIIANLGLIFVNRSWSRTVLTTLRSPNAALWWVTCGAILFLGLSLSVPFFRDLFRFSVLHSVDIAICIGAGVVSVLWFEVLKMVNRSRQISVK